MSPQHQPRSRGPRAPSQGLLTTRPSALRGVPPAARPATPGLGPPAHRQEALLRARPAGPGPRAAEWNLPRAHWPPSSPPPLAPQQGAAGRSRPSDRALSPHPSHPGLLVPLPQLCSVSLGLPLPASGRVFPPGLGDHRQRLVQGSGSLWGLAGPGWGVSQASPRRRPLQPPQVLVFGVAGGALTRCCQSSCLCGTGRTLLGPSPELG